MSGPVIQAAQSFPPNQVRFLKELVRTLQRGGDVRQLMRSAEWATFCRKVQTMERRIEAMEAERRALQGNGAGGLALDDGYGRSGGEAGETGGAS